MNFPDFGELIFPRPVATQAKKAKQSYVGLLDRRMKNYVTLLQITSEVKKKKKKNGLYKCFTKTGGLSRFGEKTE